MKSLLVTALAIALSGSALAGAESSPAPVSSPTSAPLASMEKFAGDVRVNYHRRYYGGRRVYARRYYGGCWHRGYYSGGIWYAYPSYGYAYPRYYGYPSYGYGYPGYGYGYGPNVSVGFRFGGGRRW